MPPITASFGGSSLLSYALTRRRGIQPPGPPALGDVDLYIFTGSANFRFSHIGVSEITYNYLIVAGGGGGGSGTGGGGGGAGGFLTGTRTHYTPSVNDPAYLGIQVGAGGAGSPVVPIQASNGSNSGVWSLNSPLSYSTWAAGGGGGGDDLFNGYWPGFGFAGGSGGGGGGYWENPGTANITSATGGTGTPGQGNSGGVGSYYGGGGGGANTTGGLGVSANNVRMVKASIYSSYGDGSRGANYSVQASNNGFTWTTSFSGVMSSSGCGIVDGSITSGPTVGRSTFWRYVVGSATNNHHPRFARLFLTDEYGVTYNIAVPAGDNCSDAGTIPAQNDNFVAYAPGSAITTGGNGGQEYETPFVGAIVSFSGGGGGAPGGLGGGPGGAGYPSSNRNGVSFRGGGGGGGSGTGGSGVVILKIARQGTSKNTEIVFPNTTIWTPPSGLNSIELLVVGGGGGGGNDYGGGGGAGGVRFTPSFPVTPGITYTATIGAGGAVFDSGGPGSASSFSAPGVTPYNASGGGGGGSNFATPAVGQNGGSGGGGGGFNNQVWGGGSGNSGGYTPSEGNAGGSSGGLQSEGPSWRRGAAGGGGGGAGGAGGNVPNPSLTPGDPATDAGVYRGGVGGTGVTYLGINVGGGGGGGNRTFNPSVPSTTYGGGVGGVSKSPLDPGSALYSFQAGTSGLMSTGGGGGGGAFDLYLGPNGPNTNPNPAFVGSWGAGAGGGSGLIAIKYAGNYQVNPFFVN
jgi:hypothetical protein